MSRAACVAVFLLLATSPAFADEAPPTQAARPAPPQPAEPPAPAPPGYAQPPPGYAQPPPGYAQSPATAGAPARWPSVEPLPPPPRRDKAMMAAGFTIAGVGAISLIAGVIVLIVGSLHQECTEGFIFPDCHTEPDETAQWVGAGMMIGGGVLLGVGLPIGIIGTKKENRPIASWQPSLRLGAGRVDATWRF